LTHSKEKEFFYGWYIVALGALSLFFSGPGQTYANSVFIDFYIMDFNWERSLVSGIYSGATLAAGLLLFFVGSTIDRFGQRRVSLTVSVLLAGACIWNSFVVSPWMLFVGFFLIRLLGQGSMTLLPDTLIPQWFIQKRGRAFSFMMLGGFASSTLFPPLNA
jgi:MFS family permease